MTDRIIRLDAHRPGYADCYFGNSLDKEFSCLFYRSGFYLGEARIRDGAQLWDHNYEHVGGFKSLDHVFKAVAAQEYRSEIDALIRRKAR